MERDSQMVGEWYRFIIGFTTYHGTTSVLYRVKLDSVFFDFVPEESSK